MGFKSNKRNMSESAQEQLKQTLEEFNDWYGTCRHCAQELKGSLKELREHRCVSTS